MATNDHLGDMIAITERLNNIMCKEIELLRSMRPQDIGELQETKANLAKSYESYLRELREDPSILGAAVPERKEELRIATTRFRSVLDENERALRSVKMVSENLLQTIVAAVAEQKASTSAYSNNGTLGGLNASAGNTVSFSVNKQL